MLSTLLNTFSFAECFPTTLPVSLNVFISLPYCLSYLTPPVTACLTACCRFWWTLPFSVNIGDLAALYPSPGLSPWLLFVSPKATFVACHYEILLLTWLTMLFWFNANCLAQHYMSHWMACLGKAHTTGTNSPNILSGILFILFLLTSIMHGGLGGNVDEKRNLKEGKKLNVNPRLLGLVRYWGNELL